MNDLVSSGLNLRTIEVRQLHQIVSDLNYNFTQLLHLPGFKGQTGATGASVTGATGTRGNMWIFADSTKFIANYTTITTAGQVTLAFLNGQVTANLATLLTTLNVSSLVKNDIVVLPSRDVVQFNSTTSQFVNTGIRFADGLSLTEAQVITIVNDILGGLTNTDVFTTYKGVAKNYADNATGLNTELNTNSILDIPVSGAGSGVITTDFMFASLKEASVTSSKQVMLLTGSPALYHKLTQATQENLTNDYMCGVDDFGALAVMQNSYKNGIVLGHKDSADFSTWGRIYRTENKLRFLSDFHPTLDNVGRLDLAKEGTEMYSPKDMKLLVKTGSITLTDYATNNHFLKAQATGVTLGYSSLPALGLTTSDYVTITSAIGENTDILSLQGGKLKASNFQPKSDVVVNDATKLVTHNLLHNYITTNDIRVSALETRVTTLENQKVYKQQTHLTTSVSANTLTNFGLYVFKRSTGAVFSDLPNTFLHTSAVNYGFLKVNRFHEGTGGSSTVYVEQEFSHKHNVYDRTLTSKRSGISNDGGATFVFGGWTYLLDSYNHKFTSGTKMNVVSSVFGVGGEITFNHANHTVTEVKASNPTPESHKVLKGVTLDSTGHPIASQDQDLDEWYYDKPEIDSLLMAHVPVGSIILWSGVPTSIPTGWKLCDGTNGTPNLQGKFVVGYSHTNTEYSTVGTSGGEDRHTLTTAELPAHTHDVTVNIPPHEHDFPNTMYSHEGGSNTHSNRLSNHNNIGHKEYTKTNPSSSMNVNATTNSTGGGTAFDNRPSYFVICYIQFKGIGAPIFTTTATTVTGTVGAGVSVPMSTSTASTWTASGLPSGMTIHPTSGVISGIPTTPATSTATITATNAHGSTNYTLVFVISATSGVAPVISSSEMSDATIGSSFTYNITASGSPTSYGATGLPTYLSINTSTGVISGSIPASTSPTTLSVNISATNAHGTASKTLTINVNSSATSGGVPVIMSGNRVIQANTSVSLYTIASNSPTSWGASGLPTGLTINTSTGVISGTVGSALIGTIHTVTMTATNASGTGTTTFTIKVV